MDVLLVICVGCFLFSCSTCYVYEDELRLHHDLLNVNYSTRIRPTKNMSEPTVVQAEFELFSIIEFREKDRLFSVSGGFLFNWYSQNLKWYPANFNGIISTVVPKKEVWTPLLTQINPFSDFEPLGRDDGSKEIPIRVLFTGQTFWQHNDVFSSSCRADVTVYPFDVQVCELKFLSVYLSLEEFVLQLSNRYTKSTLEHFVENGAWELVEIRLFKPDNTVNYQSGLTIRFKIKRRPMYHLVNVVFPLFVISLLNLLVFLIPAEAGERIGFSVTILLAMSVFLTIVSDKLPETSDPSVAYISYFMTIDLVVSFFVVLFTVVGLRFHFKKENEHMSDFYKWFARIYLYTCCCKKTKTSIANHKTCRKCEQNVTDTHTDGDIKKHTVSPEVICSRGAGYTKHHNVPPDVTWSHVGSMFDITLFWGFTITLVIKNIFMFIILTKGNAI